MALSHLAQAFADEIAGQDWSDAPFRADRAGHQTYRDSPDKAVSNPLDEKQTNDLLMNIIFNTGQVLAHLDPGFNIHEYALAAGLPPRRRYPGDLLHTVFNTDGSPSRALTSGLRLQRDGTALPPGRWYPLEADAKLLGIATALRDMKTPHAWGGGDFTGPSYGMRDGGASDDVKGYEAVGFDAGSLSMYLLFQAYGVQIPRTTMIQFQQSRPVTGSRRPGDLVFPAGTEPYDGMTLVDADTVARIGGPGDFLELLPYADFAASFPEVRRIL